VHRAAPRRDDVVVVHGGGPIGVGAFLALRAAGVERIVMVEPAESRAAVLRGLGADSVLDPAAEDVAAQLRALTDGYGADISFDTAGVRQSFAAAVEGTAKSGQVVLVATYHGDVSFQPNQLVLAERGISSSCGYRGEDFEAVIENVAAGRYSTEGWVTTIALDDLVEHGYNALRDQTAMKVLVDVSD